MTRQEKNDLSLPDQIATADRWIEENGATRVRVFSEAGSATTDERRAFREMIALAEGDDRPVGIILVHSLSRGFRNALDFMQYRERLRRRKVRIVSITQNFGDDPASDMAVSMLAISTDITLLRMAREAIGTGKRRCSASGPSWCRRRKDRKKLEHDPETMNLARWMFDT